MDLVYVFISGMIFIMLLINLLYMIMDTKKINNDMKQFNKFDKHILEDLKQTNMLIDLCKLLDERVTKLENKEDKK